MKILLICFVILCILSSGFSQNDYPNEYDYSWEWQPKKDDHNQDYNTKFWNKRSNYDSNNGDTDYYNFKNDYSGNYGDYYDSSNPRWDGYHRHHHHTQDKGCVTPNGEKAKCIYLENCPILKQYSYHYHQRSRFFKESICGHTNNGPLVCCGTEYQYKKNQSPITDPPAFSRIPPHSYFTPSISLLPPPVETKELNNPANIPGQQNPVPEVQNLTTTLPDTETPQSTQTRNIGLNSTSTPELTLRNHRNFNLLPTRNMCGLQSLDDRLFGGSETGLSEFPWMALLEYQLNGISIGYKCGGMLINNRYILTAAHCVFGKTLPRGQNLFRIRLGEHDLSTFRDCRMNENNIEDCNQPPQDIGIEEIIVHPDFSDSDFNMLNDIALIRLQQVPLQNDFIQPICLPTAGERANPGENLTISGWGVTENETTSRTKIKASVPYIDDNECKRVWQNMRLISDKQFCAGGSNGVSVCSGDSGGPIITLAPGTTNWYAEGIVSYGRLPCGTFTNVYTRISSYMNWILDSIKP